MKGVRSIVKVAGLLHFLQTDIIKPEDVDILTWLRFTKIRNVLAKIFYLVSQEG